MTPTPPDTDTESSPAETEPYQLTVRRSFIAQHFLTVPDPGPEGVPHSHEFTAEVTFAAPSLNEYGYVVDIDAVDAALNTIEERYRDTLLNDLPEFDGNPSVERFAERFGDRLVDHLDEPTPTRLVVRLWEDDLAWASHERRL